MEGNYLVAFNKGKLKQLGSSGRKFYGQNQQTLHHTQTKPTTHHAPHPKHVCVCKQFKRCIHVSAEQIQKSR